MIRRRRRTAGGVRPSLAFDASAGVLPAGFTCTRASKATYFDSTGTLQEAATDIPRFDYDPSTLALRGLLIEEQRTNVVPNPRAEGGGVGTDPTGWAAFVLNGLTLTRVGGGSEYGMGYMDYRVSGTSTSTSELTIRFGVNQAAASGQNWSGSLYARLTSGATTNFSSVSLRLMEQTSGGSYLVESSTPLIGVLSSTPSRFSLARTLNNASTGLVMLQLSFFAPVSSVVDITVRLYAPQLEQGSFSTSPILPPVGSPAASTRNADVVASNPIGSWFNQSAGTIVADAALMYVPGVGNYNGVVSFSLANNAATNFIVLRNSIGAVVATLHSGGTVQADLVKSVTWIAGTRKKLALAWALNDMAMVVDAASPQTDTSGMASTVDRMYIGTSWTGNAHFWGGWIRRLAYYPKRLSDAQLQALST